MGARGDAQEQHSTMLRSDVRPRLVEMGFNGSGSTFVWPTRHSIAQVVLQKSRTSNRQEVWFTANAPAVGLDEWATVRTTRPNYFPERPAPNEFYSG